MFVKKSSRFLDESTTERKNINMIVEGIFNLYKIYGPFTISFGILCSHTLPEVLATTLDRHV